MPSHCPSPLHFSFASRAFIKACLLVIAVLAAESVTRAQDITVSGTDGPRSEAVNGKARDSQKPLTVKARVAAGSLPPSRLYAHINAGDAAATHRLSPLTEKLIRRQQSLTKRNPIGITRELPRAVRRTSDATTFDTPEGRISLIKIVAEDALQLRAHFTDVAIPDGARLFVYSAKNPDEVYGAFTGRGDADTGEFWTPPIEGDAIIVEYVAAQSDANVASVFPFSVDRVSHIYGDATGTKAAGTCNQNVPEEWKATARSVGRIQFVSGSDEFLCTGTLLNSRNNDLTPYFLTANHCINTAAEAQTAYIRWFYDSPSAPASASPASGRMKLLSTNATTDYTLLMIEGSLPPDLRWAGWSTTRPGMGTNVTGIHHPDGDYKRISYGSLINDSCPSAQDGLIGSCENYHKVRWTSGTTEDGSSGSGLWAGTSADPLLVGTLWGGFASCANPSRTDYYGRFDLTYNAIASFLEGGSDDEFESNDTRQAARPLSISVHNDLIVKSTDEDWYRVSIPARAVLSIGVFYKSEDGYINSQVFRGDEAQPIAESNNIKLYKLSNNTDQAVDYFVRTYITTDTRNSYTLNMSVENCTYALEYASVTTSYREAGRSVMVTVPSGCEWKPQSSAPWLLVYGTHTGSYSLGFYTLGNPSDQPRVGTITIGNQILTVTQAGAPCDFQVTPAERFVGQKGGTSLTKLSFKDSICTGWSAVSNADWINVTNTTINDSVYDSNIGVITYTVAANPSTEARIGTLVVAGKTVTVKQAGIDPAWQSVALTDRQVQMKYWRAGGRPQVYVKITFPNTGYRVTDWGQPIKHYNTLNADIHVERFTGASSPVETTTAQIYDLNSPTGGDYTFTLRFAGGGGMALPFNIAYNQPQTPNPLDEARRFAQEHYRDFLSREPDTPGLDFWSREITSCNGDARCIDAKRVNVSGSFFLSQEFQATGYYVYRVYKGALGRVPYYSEFMPDTGKVAAGIVVNNRLSADVINDNKEAFVREFVARAEFRLMYDAATDAEFVDRLFQKTGATPTTAERDALLTELSGGAGTQSERRARVLMRIVDGIRAVPPANGGVEVNQVFETRYGKSFYDREYNPAFVQMQYFGYLRRDPDQAGFEFWLNKLNAFGNFKDAEMVRSFILAPEYRARFGQP